jgi:uncharacterized protein (UPF0210 family)
MEIEKVLGSCTAEELYEGKYWYPNMKEWCYQLSKETNLNLNSVISIFSAFSPIKSVQQCMTLTDNFCKGLPVQTVGNQINKAEILKKVSSDKEIEKILKGFKTVAFYNAIKGNPNSMATIDVHMWKLAPQNWKTITPVRYVILSNSLKKFNPVNVHELQAQLWVKLKQLEKI